MNKSGRRFRIHIPNTIHHVMIRGNNRQCIFYNEKCFERFIEIMADSVKKFDHQFLCYCLMTNHAHLLIHIHDDRLSQVMQYINYRYARWLNRQYKKIGHLFQDRYRSIEVGDENYLLNLCRYIHLNPQAANMVKNLDEYRWSSHQYYMTEKTPNWLIIDFMLSVIKHNTNQDYYSFIAKPVDHELWKPAMFFSDDGNIIFDEDVIHQMNLENNLRDTVNKKFLSEKIVCDIVCKHLNIDYKSLQCASRKRRLSQQRILLANFWMTYSNLGIVDIAKRFHRTHGTLLRQLASFHAEKNQCAELQILTNIELEINALMQ